MTFTHQSINGQILPVESARIPLTDLGMLRAYAIFDFFRVLEGIPVFLEDHLDRLMRSASTMGMRLPWTREDIRTMILDLITANNAGKAGFRVVITGGFSEDGFTPDQPNIFMMLHALPEYDAQDYVRGCKLISSAYVRDVPTVKTCIYVHSLLENTRMREAGAMEVLYHSNGSITECSRSNVFFVTPEGALVTPKDGMLLGITRKQVLAIAADKGIPFEFRDVHLEELGSFSEVFLTSSTRGVLPIIQIDDLIIGDGHPGAVTTELHEAFEALVRNVLSAGIVHHAG
jgi:D-alanine transaminase/branched-chain amino acid aminotransferase